MYKWFYMIKLLDQKNYIFMNEYYVLHFYQVRPTIKYYLVYIYIHIYNMLCILYLIYVWYIELWFCFVIKIFEHIIK